VLTLIKQTIFLCHDRTLFRKLITAYNIIKLPYLFQHIDTRKSLVHGREDAFR